MRSRPDEEDFHTYDFLDQQFVDEIRFCRERSETLKQDGEKETQTDGFRCKILFLIRAVLWNCE